MDKTCFVCDKPASQWLPELDAHFCSDECMKLFLEEWVESTDPLEVRMEGGG